MRRPEQSHTQLERELAILSNHPIQDAGALVTVKQRVRVIKNRLSAKRSREQARHYVEELEKNVAHLASESEKLSRRLAQVEEENRRLMATTPDGAQAGPCAQEPVALPVVAAEKEQVKEPAVLPQLITGTCRPRSEGAPARNVPAAAPLACAQSALLPLAPGPSRSRVDGPGILLRLHAEEAAALRPHSTLPALTPGPMSAAPTLPATHVTAHDRDRAEAQADAERASIGDWGQGSGIDLDARGHSPLLRASQWERDVDAERSLMHDLPPNALDDAEWLL